MGELKVRAPDVFSPSRGGRLVVASKVVSPLPGVILSQPCHDSDDSPQISPGNTRTPQ